MTVDGNGSLDAHCELQSVSNGMIADEDLPITTSTQTTYEKWWKEGAGGYWRKSTADSSLVYLQNPGDRPSYNQFTGGAWQLTEVTNNQYMLVHLFTTSCIGGQNTKIILGENIYANAALARDGADTELASLKTDGLATEEYVSVSTHIIHCKDTYTNDYNAITISTDDGEEYVDWRTNVATGVCASTTDHANLANLDWDDSNHRGTADKLVGFDSTGAATYYDQPDENWDGGSPESVYLSSQVIDGGTP